MKLFISYGHNDYPLVIEQFIQDLTRRHAVWTDHSLMLGDNWSANIDAAVRDCDLFLFINSEQAARAESYCRGEILLAQRYGKRIIVISLDDTPVSSLVAAEHRFFMDESVSMSGGLDEDGYEADLNRFLAEMDRLIAAGAANAQLGGLQEFDSDAIVADLVSKGFPPENVLACVDDWFGKPSQMYMGVFGNSGSGKSTLSAAVAQRYRDCSIIHFFNYNDLKTIDFRYVLQHIIAHLARQSQEFLTFLKQLDFERNLSNMRPLDIFREYLIAPLMRLQGQKFLLIIDAFDEISDKKKRREAADILFNEKSGIEKLNGRLKILVTSRNDNELKNLLYAINSQVICEYESLNYAAMHRMVEALLEEKNIPCDETSIQELIRQSGGDFLYIRFILEEIEQQKINDITKIQFPLGMKGVCQKHFDRILGDDDDSYNDTVAPMLEIISASKTPIILPEFQEIAGIDLRTLRSFLKRFEMFIDVRNDAVTFVHKSLQDWLMNMNVMDKYFVDVKAGKKILCDYVYSSLLSDSPSRYAREYGLIHLEEENRLSDIVGLMQKPSALFPTIFYTFISDMIVREKVERITALFAAAAKTGEVSLYLTSETAKLLVQYRLTAVAEQIIDSFGNTRQRDIVAKLIALFSARRDNHRVTQVIPIAEQICQEVSDEQLLAEVQRILADAYRESGNYQKAHSLYQASLSLAQKNHLERAAYDSIFAIIDLLYVAGDLAGASGQLDRVEQEINTLATDMTAYKYYRQRGHIFQMVNQNEQAQICYGKSLTIAQSLMFPMKVMEACCSMAESCDNYAEALPFLHKCREIYDHTKLNAVEYGKSFYVEADLLLREGRYEQANTVALNAFKLLQEVGYSGGASRANLARGKALLQLGRFEEALPCLCAANSAYAKENVRPRYRFEALYSALLAASQLGRVQEIVQMDDLRFFDPADYPFLQQEYEQAQTFYGGQ